MKARSWLIYLFGLGTDLLAGLLVLFLKVFGADGYRFERPPNGPGLYALTCDVPWLPKTYGAMTLAPHVIIYRKGRRFSRGWSKLQAHEHTHGEQFEAASLIFFVLALCAFLGAVAPWLAVLAWTCGPWGFMGAGYAIAWLRGEDVYHGAQHEEAAYAITAEDDD